MSLLASFIFITARGLRADSYLPPVEYVERGFPGSLVLTKYRTGSRLGFFADIWRVPTHALKKA